MRTTLTSAFVLPLLVALAGCEEPEPEQFGTVMIELQRSPSESQSPFLGTKFITVFLDYKECLATFYTTDHPDYQQDGVQGAPIFEDWATNKLCDKGRYDKSIPTCTITQMDQVIQTQGVTDVTRLIITYDLSSDDVEGLHLPFGPLPTQELAGCSPLVQLTGPSVQGKDGMGNAVWNIASFENATARVGQGASIQIFAEKP